MRSALFLPASSPRAIQKARTLDCDVVILDLEDAVAEAQKEEARDAAVDALIYGGFGPRVGVRINGLDTPWGSDDLEACRQAGAGLIVVPKVETADYLNGVGALVQGGPRLWAMIETPLALLNLRDIAGAGLGALEGLMLGVNDLAQGLRTGLSADREPLKPWLARTVAVARAHGLLAIDGVYNAFTDAQGFAAEAAQGRLYGFDGKSLIHPSQIAAANAAFSPSEAEIAWARAVIAAFSAPEAEGKGAIRVDGQMVERLHLSEAERVLRVLDQGR